MKTLLRSLASGCGLLTIGFVVGINVDVARSDQLLAQAAPSSPSASPDKPAGVTGLDMKAIEKAVGQAAKAAIDKAAAETLERIQKAALPPELTTLRQRIGELDTLRNEITTEISEVRAKALQYALWGAAAFFGMMVLASALGGAIVAALFRTRPRA